METRPEPQSHIDASERAPLTAERSAQSPAKPSPWASGLTLMAIGAAMVLSGQMGEGSPVWVSALCTLGCLWLLAGAYRLRHIERRSGLRSRSLWPLRYGPLLNEARAFKE